MYFYFINFHYSKHWILNKFIIIDIKCKNIIDNIIFIFKYIYIYLSLINYSNEILLKKKKKMKLLFA